MKTPEYERFDSVACATEFTLSNVEGLNANGVFLTAGQGFFTTFW